MENKEYKSVLPSVQRQNWKLDKCQKKKKKAVI